MKSRVEILLVMRSGMVGVGLFNKSFWNVLISVLMGFIILSVLKRFDDFVEVIWLCELLVCM